MLNLTINKLILMQSRLDILLSIILINLQIYQLAIHSALLIIYGERLFILWIIYV